MSDHIPYGRQDISTADIDAVVAVLRSDFLTQGPIAPQFEEALARHCGAAHGVAANSATAALHMACRALEVGPGDSVWTTPITFVASANCALYCGATVDFVDVDPLTYNMCADRLAEKLAAARETGTLPKVVIPVHLAGQPCDMASIHELSVEYGFRMIEDASHAVGGRYRDEPIGNCRYSDITVFSFHPVKIITTGEGGMAVTNDAGLAAHMARFRTHGITRDPAEMVGAPDGAWYYQQIELGYNYRMTELQAALGLSQLSRLDEFVARRHEIAARYDEGFSDLPLQLQARQPDSYSGMHLYIIRVDAGGSGAERSRIFDGLRAAGVGVNVHYIPVYRQPHYAPFGFRPGDFPDAEAYYRECISLPMYPTLRADQQEFVIAKVRELVGT